MVENEENCRRIYEIEGVFRPHALGLSDQVAENHASKFKPESQQRMNHHYTLVCVLSRGLWESGNADHFCREKQGFSTKISKQNKRKYRIDNFGLVSDHLVPVSRLLHTFSGPAELISNQSGLICEKGGFYMI